MLNSRYPIALYWGAELALVYNDAWSPIPGGKHPRALGRPAREVWPEIWETIGPLFDRVFETGEGTWSEDELLPMHRHGYTEECYFNFTFSPIRGEAGRVEGIFNAVVETTDRVLGERRLRTLGELGARTLEARDVEDACRRAARILELNDADVPFALIYLSDETGTEARLTAAVNLEPDHQAAPSRVSLSEESSGDIWRMRDVGETREARVVSDEAVRGAHLPGGRWADPSTEAVVLPLVAPGQLRPTGFLVAGVNPRRRLDERYRSFFELAASHVATALVSARAYAAERERAEELAQLDRAKTAFFSNVSHEFRTPLTLLLGPLEDALHEDTGVPEAMHEHISVAHRNARRLLKLVNSLLDFSRIEAGRVQASFEPTDVAALTEDLASNFRSACEKASLELRIDCPPLSEPVYVDRDMWEKIVLNLLSNAFKFTFEGGIEVSLRAERDAAVLSVRDTGVGVPPAELPRLFERFHRVEGTRGRTYEGTGIGLALVRELAHLHGGKIDAESEPGRGTTFTVAVPLGSSHLPQDRLGTERTLAPTLTGASDYVEEALRWLPGSAEDPASIDDATAAAALGTMPGPGRVVLADDNADMRDYVGRLLGGAGLDVRTVADGEDALELVRRFVPDLVISDVMMPRLDGFELLRALRADPSTRSLPVILLSARAGEEARVEGLDAGADDYLVKPFSARELLARVETQLRMAGIRRESEVRFRTIADTAPAMLWITDVAHECTYLSRGWHDFTGQSDADGLGFGWIAAVHPDERERAQQTFLGAAERREPFALDYRVRRADGSYRWAVDAGRPRFSESGEFLGYIGSVTDVHERKLVEEALKDADKRKDEFLAMLGHELRNPLAAIRNAAELLALIDDPRLKTVHGVLDRQSGHMTRLIDGLLDVSRIARGKIDLNRQRVDLRDVIDAVAQDHCEALAARGLNLACDRSPEPVWVSGDVVRLHQVFDNVLGNAIKFSGARGTIGMLLESDQTHATARIHDTGTGIKPELLEAIFEPFQQDEQDAARAAGGLGLGLALARRLIELHGGAITAHSEGHGKGATFVVRLPLAPAPVEAPATEDSPAVAPR